MNESENEIVACIPVVFSGMGTGTVAGFFGYTPGQEGQEVYSPVKEGERPLGALLLFTQYRGPNQEPEPLPPLVITRKNFNEMLSRMMEVDELLSRREAELLAAH